MVILANLIILGFLYLYMENTFLKTTEYTIYSKKLPKTFEGFKIAQISDFHNARSREVRKSIMRHIDEAAVDITVITGDLMDSRRTKVKNILDLCDMIRGISPTYYISGNHESRKPEVYRELRRTLRDDYNIVSLDNIRRKIERGKRYIWLSGIRDADFSIDEVYVKNAFDEQEEATAKNVKNLHIDKNAFNILLAHRPEFFDVYQKAGIDLILSGHAHGGQFRIPFIGGIYAPNQGFFPKYDSGINKKKNSQMVVSRGIGNSIFPFRINNRPELVIITLVRG